MRRRRVYPPHFADRRQAEGANDAYVQLVDGNAEDVRPNFLLNLDWMLRHVVLRKGGGYMRANCLEIRFPLPVLQILLSQPFDCHRLVREMLRFMVRADVAHQTRGGGDTEQRGTPGFPVLADGTETRILRNGFVEGAIIIARPGHVQSDNAGVAGEDLERRDHVGIHKSVGQLDSLQRASGSQTSHKSDKMAAMRVAERHFPVYMRVFLRQGYV